MPSAKSIPNFTQSTLAGENPEVQGLIDDLRGTFNLDFVALGLTPFVGAPLRWVYTSGATSERVKRIVLSPGHGIGGIVLKAGKPILMTDIDAEIDPREYSSYPIVFAEDLRSFCALPLRKEQGIVAVLLCAFRTASEYHANTFRACVKLLEGHFLDMEVVASDFLSFDESYADANQKDSTLVLNSSDLSSTVSAQEEERRRISRELHDSISQELLIVSMRVMQALNSESEIDRDDSLVTAVDDLNRIQDELHNLTVALRPSTLDNFGLISALRSQAAVYENIYGVQTHFAVEQAIPRFDAAVETQVYRICQEAILNACKYSGADEVEVSAAETAGWLQLIVSDAGEGFDVDRPVIRGTGCGLTGMRERAMLIGAELQVESTEKGTVVQLAVPLNQSKKDE